MLRQGPFTPFVAVPGLNTVHAPGFRAGTRTDPGAVFAVYGLLRINGQVYWTSQPVIVSVVANAPRAPTAPPLATPPVGRIYWQPISPTSISPGGTVSFVLTFTLTNADEVQVDLTMAWQAEGGALTYGQPTPYLARRGTNTVRLNFAVGNTPPGANLQVYGIVRHAGTLYGSSPITVTVR